MAIVKCDACGALLDPKGFRKRHRTEGELEIDFFTCGKCGKEYIGFVSDQALRAQVVKIRGQQAKIHLMIRKNLRQKAIRKEEKALDRMRARALKREQALKRQYEERGGSFGQAETPGPQAADPEGVQNPRDRGDASGQVSGHYSGDGGGENGLEQDAGDVLLFRASDAEHPERSSGGDGPEKPGG